jgi:hypothetical protein
MTTADRDFAFLMRLFDQFVRRRLARWLASLDLPEKHP